MTTQSRRWAHLQWGDDLSAYEFRHWSDPALNEAFAVYHDGSTPTRWELEARILAGESDEVIGRQFSLQPEAVRWYEAIFFNVRDRLQAKSYITNHVIRLYQQGGNPGVNLETLWKWYGYWGGSRVLDAIVSNFAALPQPTDSNQVEQYFDEQLKQAIKYRAAVATQAIPWDDPKWAPRILKIWLRMLEIENRQSRSRQSKTEVDIMLNMQALVDYMKRIPKTPIEAQPDDGGCAPAKTPAPSAAAELKKSLGHQPEQDNGADDIL
jgi:hypothetical protein